MKTSNRLTISVLILALTFGSALAQDGTKTAKSKTVAPAGASPTPVPGTINLFEDKFGKVGIGTTTPTSLLTVKGMIETTMGGVKFPDGTVQTTASSINGLTGGVTLAGASGISVTPSGNTLTVSITGPVHLAINPPEGFDGVIKATNTQMGGNGIIGTGGPDDPDTGTSGGIGVRALGGSGAPMNGFGGAGLLAIGGLGTGPGGKSGLGIFASAGGVSGGATFGLAGEFRGNVLMSGDLSVMGNLSKGGGSFKIDHPLDPENKYLYHSFVELPDMMNIYNGNVTTDEGGAATITLPDYFEALNRDFRYQLTVIGTFAQAIVAEEVSGNRFTIKTNAPNVKVSWQVTGVRHDAYANKNRIPVEEAKRKEERGYYLHPEAFNQPEEKSVIWATDPEGLQKRRQDVERARKEKPEQQ